MENENSDPIVSGSTSAAQRSQPALSWEMVIESMLLGMIILFCPMLVGFTLLPVGIYTVISDIDPDDKVYEVRALWVLQVIAQLVATSLVVVYSSMIVIVSKDIATKDVTDVAKFFVLTLKYFLCFMLICHAIGIWAGISRIIYLKLRGYTCSGVSPMMLL